jgi:hypothetical protein
MRVRVEKLPNGATRTMARFQLLLLLRLLLPLSPPHPLPAIPPPLHFISYRLALVSPATMSSRRLTNRNTNRYSVTALFSMAAEQDVEIEDDLARGMYMFNSEPFPSTLIVAVSTKAFTRLQSPHLNAVQEELCLGARCTLP